LSITAEEEDNDNGLSLFIIGDDYTHHLGIYIIIIIIVVVIIGETKSMDGQTTVANRISLFHH
jgi:hypothetical protein